LAAFLLCRENPRGSFDSKKFRDTFSSRARTPASIASKR
jgi:hypothetical protein